MDATRQKNGFNNVRKRLWFRSLMIVAISLSTLFAVQERSCAQVDSNGQRYLDSPFGTSAHQRELQAQAASGWQAATPGETIIWSEDDSQFVVECRFVLAEESFVSELFQLVDTNSFESSADGVTPGLSLLRNNFDAGDFANNASLSASVRSLPTTWGAITREEHDAIFQAVRGNTAASITQAPTITVFDQQSGTLFDGTMRPFVVGIEPVKTVGGDYQPVPIVQPIEEGTILKVHCQKSNDKIRLGSQIIFNKIERVDTFTIQAGKSAGATIQIPKCNIDALNLHAFLSSNETLLIDTGHIRTSSRPMEKKGFQKLPYVGTMVGSDFEKVEHRMLVMLTVREIMGDSSNQEK